MWELYLQFPALSALKDMYQSAARQGLPRGSEAAGWAPRGQESAPRPRDQSVPFHREFSCAWPSATGRGFQGPGKLPPPACRLLGMQRGTSLRRFTPVLCQDTHIQGCPPQGDLANFPLQRKQPMMLLVAKATGPLFFVLHK